MNVSTWRLLGPHHTARSPGPKPSPASPLARRFTSRLSAAYVVTESPSITAGLSGVIWAWTASGSGVGSATLGTLRFQRSAEESADVLEAGAQGPAGQRVTRQQAFEEWQIT